MKKVLAVLLASAMTLGLVACGGAQQSSGGAAAPASKGGLIKVGIINNDPVVASRATVPQLKNLISTGKTRTKHKLTSSKLASLPGGMSVSTLKTSFALESIKTGWRTPKCTRVRRHRSTADRLM